MSDDLAKVAPPGPPDQSTPAFVSTAEVHGNPSAPVFAEIGVTGLKVYSGYVNEEYLQQLQGPLAIKTYREMADSDPIVNAVLTAIGLILRAVDWRVEPANDSAEAEKEGEFAQSLLDDMSHTWEDTVSEVLSMLTYGWSYHEVVLKRRGGPDQTDPSLRSKFNDGRIGIRKLPIRAQDSLLRWQMQEDGGVDGMWQMPPTGGQTLLIPISRGLLFRTTSRKNSPEGASILRAAYRPWYIKKNIEDMEAIGVERELAGLPVVSIPAKYLRDDAAPADKKFALTAQKIARDLKFNQQGGIVIPSDTYPSKDGSPSTVPLVDVKLLSSGGRRAIETDPIVARYNRNIAMAALADFITLGDQKGSYALSKNKSELFLRACETYLNQIATVVNRFLLPRIFSYNAISWDLMPEIKPGRVAPVDLNELGAYIQSLAGAGAPLFPNEELSQYLADVAGLPEPAPETAIDMRTDRRGNEVENGGDDGALAAEGFMSAGGTPSTAKRIRKTTPQTLYIARPVLNADAIRRWAQANGFTSTLPADDMHVTIAYSRQPVDWMTIGVAWEQDDKGNYTVPPGGPRQVKRFAGGAVVLAFGSRTLSWRHQCIIEDSGASWDWPEYQPHVTLSYAAPDGLDVESIEPYNGPIVLGPERFETIDDGWKNDVSEE